MLGLIYRAENWLGASWPFRIMDGDENREGKIDPKGLYLEFSRHLWALLRATIPFVLLILAYFALSPFVLSLAAFIATFIPISALACTIIAALILGLTTVFQFCCVWHLTGKMPLNKYNDPTVFYRYLAAALGLFGLFMVLGLFSPIATMLSLPVIIAGSLFAALVFVHTFYNVEYFNTKANHYFFTQFKREDRVNTPSAIMSRVLVNGAVFGIFVTLFLFSPLASVFSLPFVLAASAILALVFSRIFCEPLVRYGTYWYRQQMEYKVPWYKKLLAGFLHSLAMLIFHTLFAIAPFFGLFVVIGLFAPIGIALSIPLVLAASAIAAMICGRIFHHSLIKFSEFNFDKNTFYKLGTSPMTRALFGVISFGACSILIFSVLLLASLPLTLPLILTGAAGAGIGGLVVYSLKCHRDLAEFEKPGMIEKRHKDNRGIAYEYQWGSDESNYCIICSPIDYIEYSIQALTASLPALPKVPCSCCGHKDNEESMVQPLPS